MFCESTDVQVDHRTIAAWEIFDNSTCIPTQKMTCYDRCIVRWYIASVFKLMEFDWCFRLRGDYPTDLRNLKTYLWLS